MLPGIPAKKSRYQPKNISRCAVSTYLLGAELYVLYSGNEDPAFGQSSFLKRVDLNKFNGDIRELPNIYSREVNVAGSRQLHIDDDALIICGAQPEIINLNELTSLYSEAEGCLSIEWNTYGWLHYWNGKIYRGYDYHAPERGVSIVDAEAKRIVQHLDLDIRYAGPWRGELMCGQRANGNFAIYSLLEQRYICELSLECYRFDNSERRIAASICVDDRAYVLAGDTLLLIDIASGRLLREVKYLQLAALKNHMQAERLSLEQACASRMSVCGSGVVLALYSVGGYALYLDLSRDDSMVWFWSEGRKVTALNTPGDLVYGLSDSTPMAWDKYTGEIVWETNQPTATKIIQIGDQWLVLSQFTGYLHCYHWKKTYISPHRPNAL
ncbi:hypothetical protein [Pseudomonas sp. PIC25]|uniref:hypothetical protein n=1 Tax=Pseudomonas sp. PIC25 TaxID=1958773 RepID=UPI0011799A71|nr:hypothetical protein [Pseudomonas sp. PIC25]